MSLSYLLRAQGMIDGYLAELKASLAETVGYEDFIELVTDPRLSPSYLRMRLTKTPGSKSGINVVTSQVSTLLLSYIPSKQLMTTL